MDVIGDFDIFADAFPTDLLPKVFAVILEEWPKSPRPADKPLENRITNRFVGHLKMVMRKQKLPLFHFDYRPKLADPDADSESGELDIQVRTFSQHPDAFFVFECKRLNVQYERRFVRGASEYVGVEGMGCFLSGQYPATCDCGGMLGYVMDGDIAGAIAAINTALNENRESLVLEPPYNLAEASMVIDKDRVQQTTHTKNESEFLIYHLLLAN